MGERSQHRRSRFLSRTRDSICIEDLGLSLSQQTERTADIRAYSGVPVHMCRNRLSIWSTFFWC